MAEANQMDIVAASADVITATVLALRADSAAARRHATGPSLPSIRQNAGCLPPGPGVPSASRLSPTAATSKPSPSADCGPGHGCSGHRQS
jgi:hypothetical protein